MGEGEGRYTGQKLDATSPLRRDTILIPAYSWMVLRFVTDNREPSILSLGLRDVLNPHTRHRIRLLTKAGVWAFHCHLAWHMAAGLLMQISSQPSALAKLTIPQDIVTQCATAGR
jgi:FtsP/CotA-like multicopper oxidase with cupredoxin domain